MGIWVWCVLRSLAGYVIVGVESGRVGQAGARKANGRLRAQSADLVNHIPRRPMEYPIPDFDRFRRSPGATRILRLYRKPMASPCGPLSVPPGNRSPKGTTLVGVLPIWLTGSLQQVWPAPLM